MKKLIFLITFLFLNTNFALAKQPPILRGQDLQGQAFDLNNYKGKLVLINFWANWCVDCHKEMPILEEIYQQYKAQGLEVVSINIDRKKYRPKILDITKGFSFIQLMLSDLEQSSFDKPDFLPMNYLIDKNGNIITQISTNENRNLTKNDFIPLIEKNL